MKRTLLSTACFFLTLISMSGAHFYTRSVQGTMNTWAAIWTNATQTTAVAPTAGNTYELVANAVAFGSSATGGSLNNTRFRNPAGTGAPSGVQVFPGDSLTLNTNTEIRFKNDVILAGLTSVDFPGVGGNPGLILNGGVLNSGNDFVFTVGGTIHVTGTSFICPADNGAGAILQPRGIHIAGVLSGSGDIIICQAGTTVPQEVSNTANTYSGDWIIKAGWLRGNAPGSLGTGDITVDPLVTVPMTTASTLSNGPALVEIMYDIVTPGRLTLINGGQMNLHQDCTFGSANIEGTQLTPGLHTYAELSAAFTNFVAGGSGSITISGGGGGGRIVTVNTTNNVNPGAGQTSLFQALSNLQDGDTIRFNIAGAGPHVLVTPIGGYPLITNHNITIDGYSQPGSSPNANPILGGNNAQIRIVLDSTGTDSAPNPDPGLPNRPLRRSTRLDFPTFVGNTGYGDSENGVIAVFGGDNITIRGLSFIGRYGNGDENDPAVYAIALVRQATNAHVSGNWFGIAPGVSNMAALKPFAAAVAAFRWRIDGDVFSEGLTFGTDGDGVNDRAEFNVALGARIGLALELPNLKVSGNYINVFPNGLSFVNMDELAAILGTVEFFENGRQADNTIIGTDGDGVSDAEERNIVGPHSVYPHDIEIYTAGTNIVVAGNYFGVGIDGITASLVTTNPAANRRANFIGTPGSSTIRIGSNGDGVSDQLEGNLIVNMPGTLFSENATAPLVHRGNRLINNNFAALSRDASTMAAVLHVITNNILSGTLTPPAGDYTTAFIDVYSVDPIALAKTNNWPAPMVHTRQWLGSFADNGTNDLNPAADSFAFNLTSFGLAASNYVTAIVTYSKQATAAEAGGAVTAPSAVPVAPRPTISIQLGRNASDQPVAIISWVAPDGSFVAQENSSLNPQDQLGWLEHTGQTHAQGRNILELPFDAFPGQHFFRLLSQ